MNNKFFTAFLLLIFIFVYVILINMVASFMSLDASLTGESVVNRGSGGDVVVGIGDSVDVTVVRKKVYGTIIENSGKDSISSKLYLFNIISLPLRADGKNLFLAHIILLGGLSFAYYKLLKWKKKKYFERRFM